MTKGDYTKTQLIEAAKQAFYENGYKKTTIKQITDKLGVKPPLFTHYFKTKENVLGYIYENFFKRVRNRILKYEIDPADYLLQEIISSIIASCVIISDPKVQYFVYEIYLQGSNYRNTHHYIDYFYKNIVHQYHVLFTNDEFDEIRIMQHALVRDLFIYKYEQGLYDIKKIENPLNAAIDENALVYRAFYSMLKIPEANMDSTYLKAISFVKIVDFSDIKLL